MGENSQISINKRLKSFLDGLDDSYADIADETGIPKRTLYDIVKEGATIKHIYIEALCEKYQLDASWLFGDEKTRTNPQANEGQVKFRLKGGGDKEAFDSEEFYSIPFYPNVKASAGGGLIPQEGKPPLQIAFRKYYIGNKLRCSAKDLVAIKVEGDSMAPTLQSDDVILIDRSQTEPRGGQLFVIRIDNTINCKRVQELPGQRYRIMSDNKAYDPFEIEANEPNFEILGTIVWFARDLV